MKTFPLLAILPVLVSVAPLAARADEAPTVRYPRAELTGTNAPLAFRKCAGEPMTCRELRIGVKDGKLVLKGDLPADEALDLVWGNSKPLNLQP